MSTLRARFHALVDEMLDLIENRGAEWVDQSSSPLGRAKHLALVRRGTLKGHKEGRKVFVKRADIDRYLEQHAVVKVDPEAEEKTEAARVLRVIMGRRSA